LDDILLFGIFDRKNVLMIEKEIYICANILEIVKLGPGPSGGFSTEGKTRLVLKNIAILPQVCTDR